jgi:hypothetical protein
MLLYIPWSPEGNEIDDRLYKEGVSAVERLGTLMSDTLLPPYVTNFLTRIRRSEELRDSNGTPASTMVPESVENEEDEIDPTGYISESISHHSEETVDADSNLINEPNEAVHQVIECDLSNAGVMVRVSSKTKEYFKTFIEACLKDDQRKRAIENQVQITDHLISPESGFGTKFNVHDFENRNTMLNAELENLKEKQLTAFNIVKSYLTNEENGQLFMFVSGEGGTGKSKLIEVVMEFCRLHYGKQRGSLGSCVAMAPTGAAAYNINGGTWQSILGASKNDKKLGAKAMSRETIRKVNGKIRGCKLLIFDEISMLSAEKLVEISERLKLGLLYNQRDEELRLKISGNE